MRCCIEFRLEGPADDEEGPWPSVPSSGGTSSKRLCPRMISSKSGASSSISMSFSSSRATYAFICAAMRMSWGSLCIERSLFFPLLYQRHDLACDRWLNIPDALLKKRPHAGHVRSSGSPGITCGMCLWERCVILQDVCAILCVKTYSELMKNTYSVDVEGHEVLLLPH